MADGLGVESTVENPIDPNVPAPPPPPPPPVQYKIVANANINGCTVTTPVWTGETVDGVAISPVFDFPDTTRPSMTATFSKTGYVAQEVTCHAPILSAGETVWVYVFGAEMEPV